MNRAECLKEAEKIVCKDREAQYGRPEDNFAKIAFLWSKCLGTEIKPIDVAHMMILLKIARAATGKYKSDNYVDIAGYAACAAEIGGRKMTREEAISKHRKMWGWLADNPGKTKEDYLQEFDPRERLVNNCYLCEYTGSCCELCPLEWAGRACDTGGLYSRWNRAMLYEEYTRAAEIARQISELPEREENK